MRPVKSEYPAARLLFEAAAWTSDVHALELKIMHALHELALAY